MAVFRVKKNTNYTAMGNYHLRDMRLSLKTIGLLSIILSLPEDWDYTVEGLARICKDGLCAVRGALTEMETYGYLVRERMRDSKGQMSKMHYTIYEDPVHDNPALRNPTSDKPTFDNPMLDKPALGNPASGKQTQLSKDKQNKEQPSKDLPSKEGRSPYLLTSRVREDVGALAAAIEEKIGRRLGSLEKMICGRWIDDGEDQEMILLAVEDNLFRKDRFDLSYVQKTMDEWERTGVQDVLSARNRILDNHVANVRAMAEEIGYKNGNDDLTDKIVFGNEAADLQGTRDHMIKLYREGRFSDLLTWASTTYHKDILEYLPKEVRAFIEKNIA